jgi:hypothetical protein
MERAYSTEEIKKTIDAVARAKPISEEIEGSVRSLGRLSHRIQPQIVTAGTTTYSTRKNNHATIELAIPPI